MNTESGNPVATGSGWRDILRADYRRSLALVSLSVWLHASMVTAISTMVPKIVGEIGGISLVPWSFALYDIGSIVAGAGSGLLVYRYRLRGPMGIAALLFAVGSTTCALAGAMPVLVLGRLLQGIGGGGLIAISFIGIGTLFPAQMMPRAMAAVSAVWGTSAFLGPLIGALFVERLSWRLAFWFFAATAVLLAIWIRAGVSAGENRRVPESGHRFPVRRIAVLTVGVLLIAAGGIDVSTVKTPLLVVAGILLLALFLRMDSARQEDRLLPVRPIGFHSGVSAGLTMILCFTMATMAITVYGPLFMVYLHQVSILTAGYIVACTSVGWSLGAVVLSGIPASQDSRVIVLGMTMLTLSIAGFLHAFATGPVILLALLAVLEGAGFGVAWASILRRMLTLVDDTDRERVSAAIPTIQRLGYAIGAAWIGIVANAGGLDIDTSRDTTESVVRWVFGACLPMALVGLLAAVKFARYRQGRVKTDGLR